MEWSKKERMILAGCLVLIAALLCFGIWGPNPKKEREKNVREVLDSVYAQTGQEAPKIKEFLDQGEGTYMGLGIDGIQIVDSGMGDYLKTQVKDYVSEEAVEEILGHYIYDLEMYQYGVRTGNVVACKDVVLKKAEGADRFYELLITLSVKAEDGSEEIVKSSGQAGFDEENKINHLYLPDDLYLNISGPKQAGAQNPSQEQVVREVLERMYAKDDAFYKEYEEMVEKCTPEKTDDGSAGVTSAPEELMDFLNTRYSDFFTEEALTDFRKNGYILDAYSYRTKIGREVSLTGVELKKDAQVDGQYTMSVNLSVKEQDDTKKDITENGAVRLNEENQIVYWSLSKKAFEYR